jgi:hypothetical protein
MQTVAAMSLLFPVALLLAPPAHAEDAVGDVFVSVTGGGGLVFLDGATTGIIAPGVIRGVPPGTHTIRVDEGCKTGTTDVTVRVNAIERVTLALTPGTGTVKVEATPPEAEVTDGGVRLGAGSFGPVPLGCGTHTLVATAPGRQTVTYTVEVSLRGHVDVRLDLPAAAIGSIAITPTPFEAEVFVDGATKGTGPMTVDGLSAGVHTVSASLDGYLPAEQKVTVLPYQIVRSTLELAPKPVKAAKGPRAPEYWGRVGLDAGVSAAAIGFGIAGYFQYDRAVDNYATYADLTYADEPENFYANEVAAPRTLSYAFIGASAASAVTAGVLWATTKPKPAAVTTEAPPGAAPAPTATPAPGSPGPRMAPPMPGASASPQRSLELHVAPAGAGVVVFGRF